MISFKVTFPSILCFTYLAINLHAGPAPSIYWPGDFEDTLFGGVYSSNKGVTLADGENHTPGGKRCWNVGEGYMHLELLTEAHSDYQLSFWAKTKQPVTVAIKVIHPNAPDENGKVNPLEEVTEIPLTVSDRWERYSLRFNSGTPYPGPVISEVLITLWSPQADMTFIDDLSLVKTSESPPVPTTRETQLIAEKNRSTTLSISSTKPNEDDTFVQVIDAKSISGKRIQISADINYLTNKNPISSWAAVVFELRNGPDREAPKLTSTPSLFWCPIGHAAPPGTNKRISAHFDIPSDSDQLLLKTFLQAKVGFNTVRVSNLSIAIVEDTP